MNFKEYIFVLLFLLCIIEAKKQSHINSILSVHPNILFRKSKDKISNQFNMSNIPIKSFNNNDTINDAEKWIKENTVAFALIIVAIVIIAIVIIILVYFCRKYNKKCKELQDQINKISFQSGIRESKDNDNEDQLI